MTFNELIKIEPRLKELYNEARQVKALDKHFCANRVWYQGFKPRLLGLVGTGAARPELRTGQAYDLAYETIYNALPDCREGCNCI